MKETAKKKASKLPENMSRAQLLALVRQQGVLLQLEEEADEE